MFFSRLPLILLDVFRIGNWGQPHIPNAKAAKGYVEAGENGDETIEAL